MNRVNYKEKERKKIGDFDLPPVRSSYELVSAGTLRHSRRVLYSGQIEVIMMKRLLHILLVALVLPIGCSSKDKWLDEDRIIILSHVDREMVVDIYGTKHSFSYACISFGRIQDNKPVHWTGSRGCELDARWNCVHSPKDQERWFERDGFPKYYTPEAMKEFFGNYRLVPQGPFREKSYAEMYSVDQVLIRQACRDGYSVYDISQAPGKEQPIVDYLNDGMPSLCSRLGIRAQR